MIKDKTKEIISFYNECHNCKTVASMIGCSDESIRRILINNGIRRTKIKREKKRRKLIPEQDVEKFILLYQEGKTFKEIGDITGWSPSAVEGKIIKAGLYTVLNVKRCPVCGITFNGRKRQMYCSHQCRDAVCRTSVDHRINRKNRKDSDITLIGLYKRDNGRCYICGCQTSFEDNLKSNRGNIICGPKHPSIDHVIPLSKGGMHSWDNVKLACLECNRKKGDRMMEVV